jgi:MYXO-CTERM domain-containing protein
MDAAGARTSDTALLEHSGARRVRGHTGRVTNRPRYFIWFTPALGLLLGGYLFFSKSFAYVHLPGTPLFIGEGVLCLGLVEAARIPSPWRYLLRTASVLRLVGVFVLLCAVRFAFDVPTYRLDAVRDSSIWYYAAFSFLTAAAVVSEPSFVPRLVGWYGRALPAFLVWAPIAVVLSQVNALSDVRVPGTSAAINSFKPGDIAVQIAAGIGFLALGVDRATGRHRTTRATVVLSVIGLMGLLVCGSQTRGGLVAGVSTLVICVAVLPAARRGRLALPVLSAMVAVVLVVLVFDLQVHVRGRDVSVQTVAANVVSIVQRDKDPELAGTVEWRQELWNRMRNDMLASGAWRTGLGFGPALGARYGVNGGPGEPPLRNVHNSHLGVFARVGAVGLTVWVLIWLTWGLQTVVRVRRWPGGVRDPECAVAAWTLAAVTGYLVNAYFDPSLEGPQADIWLFVLLGLGAALTRRRSPVPASATEHRR